MPKHMCHYWDSREDHSVDLAPCKNCGVPVCAGCRADGYCLECADLRDNDYALALRADEMKDFYKRADKN